MKKLPEISKTTENASIDGRKFTLAHNCFRDPNSFHFCNKIVILQILWSKNCKELIMIVQDTRCSSAVARIKQGIKEENWHLQRRIMVLIWNTGRRVKRLGLKSLRPKISEVFKKQDSSLLSFEHLELTNSLISTVKTHQVGIKNVVNCYKDFFGYFNALKTHCGNGWPTKQ